MQFWFEPGTVIATGDLTPPVAPEAGYTSHWSYLSAAEGAPTYDIANLPYGAWLDALTWLGAEEELGQRLWISAWFAGSAAAIVFLTFGFTSNPLAAGAAGLLGSFNAYRLVTGTDAIPMAAIVVAALLGGLVLRAALRPERRPTVVGFALASLGLGYVMSNPPHVALVVVWVASCLVIALIARPDAARRTFAFLGKALPLALLFNAWWVVPAWLTVTGPYFDERFAARSVEDWLWTHERATIVNALTLNTSWAWDYPEYYPYADRLGYPPLDLLKLCLPALAGAGVVLAWHRSRAVALGLAVVALSAAWLATGFRAPIPGVNRWLYEYVPGYWLFREPTKLLLLVLLAMAVLAGLAVSELLTAKNSPRAQLLGVGLVVGTLVYAHPLFTGEVVADDRPLLPSAHVRVPDQWRQAADTLNAQPDTGKVMILPRLDYYQVPTTWGYYGASFSRMLVSRPVIEAQPGGGYFRSPEAAVSFESAIEQDLVAGRPAELDRKLTALGVRYILLRRDVDRDFPNRRIARSDVLAASLKRMPGVRLVRSFGILDLYRVARAPSYEVYPATPVLYAGPEHTLARAVIVSPGRPGFISKQDDQASVVEAGAHPQRLIRFEEDRIRRLTVKRRAGTLRLRLADPFRLTVGGRTHRGLPPEGTSVPIARNTPVLITAGRAVIRQRGVSNRWQNLGLYGLRAGEAVSVWQRSETRLIDPASAGPVRDCNSLGGGENTGLRRTVTTRTGRQTLRLSARANSACVTYPLVSGRSRDVFNVRFRYRQVQGRPARACLWQSGVARCAVVPSLRSSRTWQRFEAAIRPHPRATGLTLFLYADGPGRRSRTVTEYQSIRLERYRRAADVSRATARVTVFRGALATPSRLAFTPPPLSPPINFADAGSVDDCHRYDERTPGQLGLAAQIVRESGMSVLQLTARDHAACVNFAISSDEPPAATYRIRFEYRTVSGRLPRVCLWQEGPDRCASLPELTRDRGWRVVDETVALDPNVRAIRLFLYADGGGGRRTISEYRNVHAGPLGSVALVGIPKQRQLPRIVTRREAPWKFHVRVENARAPFLLATSEAFASGWKASAEGRDDSALRHVEVNGYANGWLVPWKGSYEMTLEYGPERYARAARWLSVIALLAAFGWIGLRRLRAFDVRWHTR